MSRKNIRVTAINKQPQARYVRLYVLALLELARALVEEEEPQQPPQRPAPRTGGAND